MSCKHGSCEDMVNTFTCHCHPGYTGIHCETNINECESMPCIHGNCSDNINNYTCECPGYTGIHCETELDECDSSPCVEGSCFNKVNSYICSCWDRYSGQNCDGKSMYLLNSFIPKR